MRCMKDEVALCRARIGHTHLTHLYILKKDPQPHCEHCQCNLTVRHILVHCNHFSQESKNIFGRRDVVELFILKQKEGRTFCLFNDAFNTFYSRLYGVVHMVRMLYTKITCYVEKRPR